MTLFTANDRAFPSFPSGIEDDPEPYIPSHAYQVPVARLVERLEIMGFTLSAVKRDLERCIKEELLELERQIELESGSEEYVGASYLRGLTRRRRLLQQFTMGRWTSAIRRLRALGILHSYNIPEGYKGLTPLQHYILNTEEDWESYHFGFPVSDLRFLMRALLLCAHADEQVLLDLSDLEVAGYFQQDAQPVRDATAEAVRLGRVCEKILVLTEGRTDRAS